ncbi:MAG: Gx transporter family protein [Brotaphodocola sp.]
MGKETSGHHGPVPRSAVRNQKARTTAMYGMLIALAFIFSYIESMFPMPVPIPGVKLGLANLVNVVGLYTIGAAGTAAVSLVRIVLVGLTFSNMFSMFYSLAGGALSLAVMILARRTSAFSKVGVSILGGIFHNIGQLTVAALVTKTAGVFTYFPVLLLAGVVTGAVIGLLGGMIVKRIAPAVE